MFPENRTLSASLRIGSGPARSAGRPDGRLTVECACIHYYSGCVPDRRGATRAWISNKRIPHALFRCTVNVSVYRARGPPSRFALSPRVQEVLIKQKINRVRAFTDITRSQI